MAGSRRWVIYVLNVVELIFQFLKKKNQDAFVKSILEENTIKTKPKPTLKRRVGYSEEAVSTTRAKLAAMTIDEEEVQVELMNTTGTAK